VIDLDHPYAKVYLSSLGSLKEYYRSALYELQKTICLSFETLPFMYNDMQEILKKRERKLLDYDGARHRGRKSQDPAEKAHIFETKEIYEHVHKCAMEDLKALTELRANMLRSSWQVLSAVHYKLFRNISLNLEKLIERYASTFVSTYSDSSNVDVVDFQLKRQRILQRMSELSIVSIEKIGLLSPP
jgi:hypothetical protein